MTISKTNFLSDSTQNLYHRPGILLAVAAEGFATLFLGIHVACLSGAFIITEISYIRLHAIPTPCFFISSYERLGTRTGRVLLME